MQLGTRDVQGVHRPGKGLGVVNLIEVLNTVATGVRKVEKLQHSVEVEGFPQGVRARSFRKELES